MSAPDAAGPGRALRPVRRPVRAGGAGQGPRRAGRARTGRPRTTRSSRRGSTDLLVNYAGTPSLLYRAERLSAAIGAEVLLKREDLNHTGAHKVRNVLGPGAAGQADGQAAGDRRDRRRPARRGQRHRGRPARPRVRRLHGRGGHRAAGAERGPDADARRHRRPGHQRLAHPQGRAQRGAARLGRPASTPRTTCSARRPGRTRSRRSSATSSAASASRPARSASTSSAGCRTRSPRASAAVPTRSASSTRSYRTQAVRLYGFEAGGDGVETGRHAASITGGSAGVLHGARTYVLQDDDGQTIESHSISAGPGLSGRRPGARLAARHRPGDLRAGHRRRGDGRVPAALPHRGHHPGDRERARAGRRRRGSSRALTAELGRTPTIVVNLSGRGDKDVHTAGAYFGILDEREHRAGGERMTAAPKRDATREREGRRACEGGSA